MAYSGWAGALSQAISDSFRGLNEGQEERRKEEEAGRRTRAEITEQAYQPIRFKQGQLQNQQLEQSIDIAGKQEARTAGAYPLQQRILTSQAITSEVEAKYAEQKAKLAIDSTQANLDKVNEELKVARTSYPYLVDQLEATQRKLNAEVKALEFKNNELFQARARRNKAGAALLAAGLDMGQIARVLAEYGQDIDPNDPYVQWLKANIQAQASAEGRINPLTVHAQKEVSRRAAINDAQQDAVRMLSSLDIDPRVGDLGVEKMRSWLQQYNYARYLRQAEAPNLGIVYSETDKVVTPMPDMLVEALAEKAGQASSVTGSPEGKGASLDIYSRMNEYVTQGIEWSEAMRRATSDFYKAKQGVPTASDRWVPVQTKSRWDTLKDVIHGKRGETTEDTGKVIKELWTGKGQPVLGTGSTVPESALPPRVTTSPSESTEMAKRNKLNSISQKEYNVPWEVLLYPENAEAKKYVEEQYQKEMKGNK